MDQEFENLKRQIDEDHKQDKIWDSEDMIEEMELEEE